MSSKRKEEEEEKPLEPARNFFPFIPFFYFSSLRRVKNMGSQGGVKIFGHFCAQSLPRFRPNFRIKFFIPKLIPNYPILRKPYF